MKTTLESNNVDVNVDNDIAANSNANDGNDFTANRNENDVIDLTANSNANDGNDFTANSDDNDGNDFENKSAAGPSTHLPQQPRPNVDILLSYKDPFFLSVMTKILSLETTGTKMHQLEKMAKEALLLFKNRNITLGETLHEEDDATTTTAITPVRFFKSVTRYNLNNWVEGPLMEVDETAALRSECYVFCNDHICTKTHHLTLWNHHFCVRYLSNYQYYCVLL